MCLLNLITGGRKQLPLVADVEGLQKKNELRLTCGLNYCFFLYFDPRGRTDVGCDLEGIDRWTARTQLVESQHTRCITFSAFCAFPLLCFSTATALSTDTLLRPPSSEGSCDPIAPKIFHRAPSCDSLDVDYVSENCDVPVTKNRMDEQVSCEFHSERKRDPGKFKNQLTNQGTTRMVGCFPNPPFFKSPSDVSSWDSFFLDAIRVRSQLEPQQGGAPTDLQLLDRRQSLLSLVAPVIKNL
ncbi:uncharacterized protein LOC112885148 [Panicum hallii]|uniref:uncharacterized protein LOC112885148 n=1 Tax=Panicum hallii TaxID=206008 RepID=UPI000DF4ED13|nr:uncharacterized protein LOC112885148 [Panicum hallii]